ncbi:hypothetical protein LOAG_09111 [Loa loa]|uniref:Uncharacterized protein n=1 Tax=Loa loa TaxID=7209 RepID=A0A1S0TSJ4_LOALO|nr:hypothetical protein LOAG_09111 [Loa loa]EFO19386.1 hypothetical protein LOAG_09111 [Loa loa]
MRMNQQCTQHCKQKMRNAEVIAPTAQQSLKKTWNGAVPSFSRILSTPSHPIPSNRNFYSSCAFLYLTKQFFLKSVQPKTTLCSEHAKFLSLPFLPSNYNKILFTFAIFPAPRASLPNPLPYQYYTYYPYILFGNEP